MAREMTPEQARAFMVHGTRTIKVATTMTDGHPHLMPVWFVLDGDVIVFTTPGESVKGRALRRDPRIALVVDEEVPPYAFVHIRGRAEISEDLEQMVRFATEIGARYMGADRAKEYGTRNAVPGELLIRVKPERVISNADVAGY